MTVKPRDSVFFVTSRDPDNREFGTAFAFAQYDNAIYCLTCRHVVSDVGGPDEVRVGGHPAKVVASGSEDGFDDLSVLRVEGLRDVPILRLLKVSAVAGSPVKVLGFTSFAQRSIAFRPLRAQLGEQVELFDAGQQSEQIVAWDLVMEAGFDLERGYSGAPVLSEKSGAVVGIATYRMGGRKGVALSIGTLDKIQPLRTRKVDTRSAERFWQSAQPHLGLMAVPVDSSFLQSFEVPSGARFSTAIGTRAVMDGYRRRLSFVWVMIVADGLSNADIEALLTRLDSGWELLARQSSGGLSAVDVSYPDIEVFLLFSDGVDHFRRKSIIEQLLKQRGTHRGPLKCVWTFDLSNRKVYSAGQYLKYFTRERADNYQAIVERFER